MDIFKVLLVYMAMTVTGPAQQAPDLTPPPVTPPPAIVQTEVPPAPTDAPVIYDTLKVGSKGENVRKMQQKLIELGFLSGKADGEYGPKTKEAVAAFQRHCGLKVDGAAGNETLTHLYSETPLATPTPAPTVIPAVMVPVYYMDQDTGAQLFSMDITCYGSTTIYANGNHVPDGYRLLSQNAVEITLEGNTASPASVSFYYTSLPEETKAPAAVTPHPPKGGEPLAAATEKPQNALPAAENTPLPQLTRQGETVLLNGETAALPWFTDEQGTVWLPLEETANLLQWNVKENEPCNIFNQQVLFTYTAQGLYSIKVNDTLCTEHGLHLEGKTYISLPFLQLLQCHTEMTENIPDISLSI